METIDQIRQVANIVDIASLYTTLRRRGRKHVGLCPFHSEKDPSFTVDSEKQLFHCFGCGVGGDIFTLVMEKENLSFPEALNYLAERYHVPLPQKARLSPELVKLEEKIYKANETALAFFRRSLFQTDEGRKAASYLKKRNLSEETLETLKVGYAPNSWNALLTYFQGKGIEPSLLEKAGLVLPGQKKSDYYDRFRGRVIFPIFSLTGKVVAFGGRTIADADPKYLNSPDTPVYSKGKLLYGLNWTKEAVREAGEVILVEGYTDFASLYQAGVRNIAASLGTALTTDQVYLAYRFAERMVINYDGDHAGKAATSRGIPLCFELGKQPEILVLPDNLDPDGFIRKHGAEEYKRIKETKSSSLINFMIELQKPKKGFLSRDDRIAIASKIMDTILINPDTISGSEYLKELCEYLDLNEQIVRSSIKRGPDKTRPVQAEEYLLPAEKRLLQILCQNPQVAEQILARISDEDLVGLKSEPAFRLLRERYRHDREIITSDLSKALPPQVGSLLSLAMMERLGEGTPEEALDCLLRLRMISLDNRRKAVQKETERCQKSGDQERVRKLLAQYNELTKTIYSLEKERL